MDVKAAAASVVVRRQGRLRRTSIGIAALLVVAGLAYAWLRVSPLMTGPVVSALPAVIDDSAKPLILFLSGDAGWQRGVGRRVMQALAAKGYPVLGFDSLAGLQEEKQPAILTAELLPLLKNELQRTGKTRWVLIGHSFGAAIAPWLPETMTNKDVPAPTAVALLAPTPKTAFRVSLYEVYFDAPDDPPTAPAIARVAAAAVPVLCIAGVLEAADGCDGLEETPGVIVERVQGSHSLGHDADPLANSIDRFLAMRR